MSKLNTILQVSVSKYIVLVSFHISQTGENDGPKLDTITVVAWEYRV